MPKPCYVSAKIRSLASTRRWFAREAEVILEAGRRSGLAWRDFARSLGVDPARLYRWRSELEFTARESDTSAIEFVPLVSEDRSHSFSGFQVVFENGRQVGFSADVPVELATAVIKAAAC